MKYTLDSQESKELFPGFEAKFIHSDNMTITFVEIKAGAELPEHNHPHEQITFVREGTLQITMDNEEYLLEKGELLVIPPVIRSNAGSCTYPMRQPPGRR